MILIVSKSRKKYWTDDYSTQDEYLVMRRQTKEGKSQTILIPRTEISEIVFNDVVVEGKLDKLTSKKVK
jgi:hypothetical protein